MRLSFAYFDVMRLDEIKHLYKYFLINKHKYCVKCNSDIFHTFGNLSKTKKKQYCSLRPD